jgi:hypothetical protein
MRFAWISFVVALPFALSTCGDSNSGDENDDGDSGGSSAGAGRGGAGAGDAGSSARGGASSGTNGTSGDGGDDGMPGGAGSDTGGTSGASGASGTSGTGGSSGCETREADVLILLDRSVSMQEPPEGIGVNTPKWDLTVPPLVDAVSNITSIRWGLKVFPEDEADDAAPCAAGSVTSRIDVPIADDSAQAVQSGILGTLPSGPGTPTGDALRQALTYLEGFETQNPKFILLVTDGEPSCINVTETSDGVEGPEEARPYAIQAIADAFTAGIPTYLLGVGTNNERARETLDAMAVAGNRPAREVNPLASLFYLVNDTDGADDALDSVLTDASSCGPQPPASIPLPYSEDFESGSASGWSFIMNPWAVIDDAGNSVFQLETTGDSETTWAIGGDRNWTNVRVQMRVKFVTGEGMILLSPRWQNLDNQTFVEYQPMDLPKLRRRTNGSTSDLITATMPLTFAPGQWHTVAVTLNGTAATLEFDGTVLGTATDPTPLMSGGIGVAIENGIAAIDDVRVSAP